jgi:hypothetical protein
MKLEMPAISTKSLPSETARYVDEAYREVKNEPRVGIIEERYHGDVPVHIDRKPPYAGVTEIRPVLRPQGMEPESVRMGISDSLPTYKELPNGRVINYKKRVGKHESRHVKSEKLTKYLDVPRHLATLIMESYAELGGMIANPKEKDEILLTTPYKEAIKFGLYAEKFYESTIDKSRGYAAFIKDIQRYKSAHMAIRNLGKNIKAMVDNGVDVKHVIDSAYHREEKEALRPAA